MKTHTIKQSKLAIATLALCLSQGSFAAAQTTSSDGGELKGTYWGLGLGTVLGAVIAGPPGAAAGAALGGSIGWGQDKDTELDALEQDITVKQQRMSLLEKELYQNKQQAKQLQRENALQAAQLADAKALENGQAQADDLLKSLAGHYAQEIYYRHNQSAIPDYAKDRLAGLVEFMKQHPSVVIRLQGHTDLLGSEEANIALAKARVDAIKDELVDLGIDDARIHLEALGESHATAEAGDAANYVLDRRVAIHLDVGASQEQPYAVVGEGM